MMMPLDWRIEALKAGRRATNLVAANDNADPMLTNIRVALHDLHSAQAGSLAPEKWLKSRRYAQVEHIYAFCKRPAPTNTHAHPYIRGRRMIQTMIAATTTATTTSMSV
jgi:hypothetical protein